MKASTTNIAQAYEQFVAERKEYLGGSDAPSVVNKGNYGCKLKLFWDKTGRPKDVEDSESVPFRRGRRLEGIAASYYEQVTGRETWTTTTMRLPGRPYLAVNMDRLVFDPAREGDGYLEIKTVGLFSFKKIQKDGLPDDYLLQVQWGMAVSGLSWGSFAIYCPDEDALLHWDFKADRALGEMLLEAGEDFWNFNVQLGIAPEPLPEIGNACYFCPFAISCRGYQPVKPRAPRKSKTEKEETEE